MVRFRVRAGVGVVVRFGVGVQVEIRFSVEVDLKELSLRPTYEN